MWNFNKRLKINQRKNFYYSLKSDVLKIAWTATGVMQLVERCLLKLVNASTFRNVVSQEKFSYPRPHFSNFKINLILIATWSTWGDWEIENLRSNGSRRFLRRRACINLSDSIQPTGRECDFNSGDNFEIIMENDQKLRFHHLWITRIHQIVSSSWKPFRL